MSVLSGQESYCSMHEQAGAGAGCSGASVFTHSSVYTTQSTRSRRPGAAKERLARAKEAEERRRSGWHESMEAAAASAHRVWEPKVGWVDYEDPVNTTADLSTDTQSTMSADQMHLKLNNMSKRTAKRRDGGGTWIKQLDELERYPHVNHSSFSQGAEAKNAKGKKKSTKKTKAKKSRTRIVDSVPASLEGNGKDNDTCFPSRRSRGSPERRRRQHNPSGSPVPREQAPARSRPRQQQSRSPASPLSGTPPTINRVTDQSSLMSAIHNARSARIPERRVQSLSPQRRGAQGATSTTSSLPHAAPRPSHRSSTRHSPVSPMPSSPASRTMDNDSPARSTRSKGWVETMREATSSLEKEGHSWDPKFGFSNLNLDATSVSNNVIHNNVGSSNTTPAPATDSGNRQSHPLQASIISQQNKGRPADVLEAMIAERRKNDPPGRKNPMERHEGGNINPPKVQREVSPESRPSLEKPLENTAEQEETLQGQKTKFYEEEEQSTLPEPIEVTPEGVMDSSGNTPDLGIVALNYEEEEDYLVGPSAPVVVTPNINVNKEKVGSGDFALFPTFKKRRNQAHGIFAAGPTIAARNDFLKSHGAGISSKPSSSRRRNSGPVDVDEVDDISSEESENENSNVWETSKFENDSFLQGSISSSKRRGQENTIARGISPPRASSFTKQLTKQPTTLWPEHARRLAQTVRGNSDDNLRSEGNGQNTRSQEDGQPEKASENHAPFGDSSGQKVTSEEDQAGEQGNDTRTSQSASEDINDENTFGASHYPDKPSPQKRTEQVANRSSTTRTHAQETASDDRSNVSSTSSATAGWKSFLQKKVQAERAAIAASQQQFVFRDDPRDKDGKEGKINKNVSFASEVTDSLLAESSIFDFSTSDSQSPARDRDDSNDATNSRSSSQGPYSPKRGARSFERKISYSPNLRQDTSYDSADSHLLNHISPDRNLLFRKNRSFGTDVSPISERDEDTESIAGKSTDPGQHSFLKRLAECRGPILPPRQNHEKSQGGEDGKEEGVAHNLYMHGSKAAEKVEEMMEILRSRRCNVRERGDTSKSQDASATFRDKLSSRLQVSTASKPNSHGEDEKDPDTKAFEDLAKARVEAMLDTLYYSNEE